jgi:hypothetical protein
VLKFVGLGPRYGDEWREVAKKEVECVGCSSCQDLLGCRTRSLKNVFFSDWYEDRTTFKT